MDTKAIDQKGLTAIQADLDRIYAMDGKPAITGVVTSLYLLGSNPFFRFSSEPDAKNSSEMIAGLDQGGIGLPDTRGISARTINRWSFADNMSLIS